MAMGALMPCPAVGTLRIVLWLLFVVATFFVVVFAPSAIFVAFAFMVSFALDVAVKKSRPRRSAAARREPQRRDTPPDPYDLVFEVDDGLLKFIRDGWAVRAPTRKPDIVRAILTRAGVAPDEMPAWVREAVSSGRARRGKIVALVGRYGAGKTFAANGLYRAHFESGSLVHTRGISLKWLEDSQMVLMDTNGGLMPVAAGSEEALADRRMTEMFTQDLVLAMADHVVVVVNELTSADQEYIDALARKLGQTKRTDLFVVHNFANAASPQEASALWRERVEIPYAAADGYSELFEEDDDGKTKGADPYHFFVSHSHGVRICHVHLAREGTPAGDVLNARTYRVLRAKLQALVPSRPFDPCRLVEDYARRALPVYLNGPVGLAWRAVGTYAGDEVSGADDDVVCRLVNAPPPAPLVRGATAPPKSVDEDGDDAPVGLRMKLVYAHMGLGVGVAAPDFEAPVEVVDHGDRLVVHIDAPGTKNIIIKECAPEGDSLQFVEVTGQRDPDHHLVARPIAPLDVSTIGPVGRGVASTTRTAQLVWPMPQPRRFGAMCVRITMPPGSRLDHESIWEDMGIVRFVILRQTQTVTTTLSSRTH
jgi:hypothetical protein